MLLEHGFTPVSVVRCDQDGRVLPDSPCIGCGYDLNGLQLAHAASDDDNPHANHPSAAQGDVPRTGTCPECGADVAEVRSERSLALADPAWVAGLASGSARLRQGLLAMPVGLYPGVLWSAIGVWALTRPEPAGQESLVPRLRRLLARWCPWLGLPLVIVGLIGAGVTASQSLLRGDFALWDWLLAVGHGLLLLGAIQAWHHLHTLSLRAGASGASRDTQRAWWRWIIGVLILTAVLAVLGHGEKLGLSSLPMAMQWAGVLGALAVMLLLAVWMGASAWQAVRRCEIALAAKRYSSPIPGRK